MRANMPEKPTEPRLPADADLRRRSRERLHAIASLRGLPRSAYADPVDDWKRQALANARANLAGAKQGFGLTLQVKLGFVLLVMSAGAPLGVVGWAVTLLTFLSLPFVQELPSVLWALGAGRSANVVVGGGGAARSWAAGLSARFGLSGWRCSARLAASASPARSGSWRVAV